MVERREQLIEIMKDAAKGETKASLRAEVAALKRQLAEARAERDAAREYGKEARVLGTKAEDKRIHEQHMRSIAEARAEAAEAERDRLAADNVRLREALAKIAGTRMKSRPDADIARAALAGKE